MCETSDVDTEFHFSEWAFLARVDPDAFERRRRMTIERFLNKSGRQKSLGLTLQREIDAERARAGDSRLAMLAISRMMFRSLAFLGEELSTMCDQMKAIEHARQANIARKR